MACAIQMPSPVHAEELVVLIVSGISERISRTLSKSPPKPPVARMTPFAALTVSFVPSLFSARTPITALFSSVISSVPRVSKRICTPFSSAARCTVSI